MYWVLNVQISVAASCIYIGSILHGLTCVNPRVYCTTLQIYHTAPMQKSQMIVITSLFQSQTHSEDRCFSGRKKTRELFSHCVLSKKL